MKFIDYMSWLNEAKWDEDIVGASIPNKGQIEANVGQLAEFIKKGNYPEKEYIVKELYSLGSGKHSTDKESLKDVQVFDKETDKWVKFPELPKEKQDKFLEEQKARIMKSDLSYPIIVGEDEKDKTVVDGNHRLEKAYLTKKQTIKGIAVPWKDLLKKFKK